MSPKTSDQLWHEGVHVNSKEYDFHGGFTSYEVELSPIYNHKWDDPKWQRRYMNVAKEIASWSKDPSTKVGVVAVSPDGKIIAQGYNGFPRGIRDEQERYDERELKYKYINHGEESCIYDACYHGVSLRGASIFIYSTTGIPPCNRCSRGMIQCGIVNIFYNREDVPERWEEECAFSLDMLEEAGVKVLTVDLS